MSPGMQCPRCHQENPPQARFCMKCGAGLTLACAKCGTELPTGAAFCFACGQPVTAAPVAQRFASPEAYTPKHLAEKILTSKSALEGERKQVTVLFADLKGSMELLADRDPEEARKLLDPVLERMMEAVHRYEGTVNQVMGDGIMALFGAPLAHEDHAVRACYAALRMQDAVKRLAEEAFRAYGVAVQIRVGLNSGDVVVRAIGSDLHMDYTAVGQTTHLAARMEQLASPGSILLTPLTLQLAEGYIAVTPRGPVPVKGLAEPVEVYEMTGAAVVRSRLQVSAVRGLTKFVGRTVEIEQLNQALGQARSGHGQVVAVVGEPGVGKSRLYWEFTHSHRTQGCLIIESSSVSYGKATPYLPIIDLLRAYFQIEPRDEARKIREKVTGKLLSLDRQLEPSLPAFLCLLDVPAEDAQWERLDPPLRRQRTLDGVKRLLLRESQVQPLLVLLEDLHWIDGETQALLDSLVESLPTAPVLLLVNYRPEYQHGWGGKTYYRLLRIDPLPAESVEELLDSLLGKDPPLAALKRLLMERSEGNPFFLEESVRTLVETKALEGERGAYYLARATQSLQIPATAQAVLAARIDRLSPEDKRLLQAASVIGKDVPFALLQAIADEQEDTLRRSLTQLQAAEFLYEARLFPDLEYTFKHALTHEVAYATLLQDRRRALDVRIVEAIEALHRDRLTEQVERLAHHTFRGEVWDKAVAYFRQAGAKAAVRSAYREAVTCFEQALTALTHLPESGEALEQGIDLRLDLRNSLHPLGEHQRLFDHLCAAEPLAERIDDQRRLGWISAYMATYFAMSGNPDRAAESGQRTLSIAKALGELPLQVAANFRLGLAYLTCDYRRASEFFRSNIESLKGELIRERFGEAGPASVLSRFWLVPSLAELGEFAEGIARGEEGVQIAETVDHPWSLIGTYHALGYLYLRKGELTKAIPVLERGFGLGQAYPTFWLPWIASALGYAYALSGRAAEALPLLEQGIEQAASRRQWRFYALQVAYLSEAYRLSNRLDDAIRLASQALDSARDYKARGQEAWALWNLGELASHHDPPDAEKAEASYRQAMGLAEELEMRPLAARCHLGLGKLYSRTGDRPKAQEHLTTAATLLREMDMRFWLEQAEAELKGLG